MLMSLTTNTVVLFYHHFHVTDIIHPSVVLFYHYFHVTDIIHPLQWCYFTITFMLQTSYIPFSGVILPLLSCYRHHTSPSVVLFYHYFHVTDIIHPLQWCYFTITFMLQTSYIPFSGVILPLLSCYRHHTSPSDLPTMSPNTDADRFKLKLPVVVVVGVLAEERAHMGQLNLLHTWRALVPPNTFLQIELCHCRLACIAVTAWSLSLSILHQKNIQSINYNHKSFHQKSLFGVFGFERREKKRKKKKTKE